MGTKKIKHFVVENRIDEISSLAEAIDALASNWKLSSEQTMHINLVLEETLSNIIFYAFRDTQKHEIKISLSQIDSELTIKIIDDGAPFNPVKQKAPDINLPAEDRAVGGLGIFLISQMMDEVLYDRKDNQNILTLKKQI